jgi:hypothetical protein
MVALAAHITPLLDRSVHTYSCAGLNMTQCDCKAAETLVLEVSLLRTCGRRTGGRGRAAAAAAAANAGTCGNCSSHIDTTVRCTAH